MVNANCQWTMDHGRTHYSPGTQRCDASCLQQERTKISYSFRTGLLTKKLQLRSGGLRSCAHTAPRARAQLATVIGEKLRRIDGNDTLKTTRQMLMVVRNCCVSDAIEKYTSQSLLMELSGRGDVVRDLKKYSVDILGLANASKR
jgi:hypothetical protein